MSTEPAISVSHVSKAYPLFDSPWHRLRHLLTGQQPARGFKALNDISFEVAKGESVGIIGRNGSGKSTLLQIIAGTLAPSDGEVHVSGKVAALLELGSGFNPEFTGRENVYLNGAILGCSRGQMDGFFDEIAAFADIGDFIDEPVKEYSSGMMMRLAFAVQVVVQPDILIIDEALSVGDFFFQQKCLDRMRKLREDGATLLLVSHDMATVRNMCSRAIYLQNGQAKYVGETQMAIRHFLSENGSVRSDAGYLSDTAVVQGGKQEFDTVLQDAVWAASGADVTRPGRLIAVALYDGEGKSSSSFRLGSVMQAKVLYWPALDRPTHISIGIRDKYNNVISALGSSFLEMKPPAPSQGVPMLFDMRIGMPLEAGAYSLVVNLGFPTAPNQGEILDTTGQVGPITIVWDYQQDTAPFLGSVGLPFEAEFKAMSKGEAK